METVQKKKKKKKKGGAGERGIKLCFSPKLVPQGEFRSPPVLDLP